MRDGLLTKFMPKLQLFIHATVSRNRSITVLLFMVAVLDGDLDIFLLFREKYTFVYCQ